MRYLLMLALLAGCARPAPAPYFQPQTATDMHRSKCEKIGFARDTDAWRSCVLQQYQHAENLRAADDHEKRAALLQIYGTMQQPRTCSWVRNVVRCY